MYRKKLLEKKIYDSINRKLLANADMTCYFYDIGVQHIVY